MTNAKLRNGSAGALNEGGVPVIGTLINKLRLWRTTRRDGDSMLLTRTEFNREVSRERIRATRRSIPFCVLTIELVGNDQIRSRRRQLIRILHRDIRLTDQKADLGGNHFGVLLVDTPEMGGRSVLDRLSGLCEDRMLDARLSLRVHDPEGFDPDHDSSMPTGTGQSRREDNARSAWVRIDRTAHDDMIKSLRRETPKNEAMPSSHSVNSNHSVDAIHPAHSINSAKRLVRGSDDAYVTSEETMMTVARSENSMKRAVDVLGASIGLMVASPVMLFAAAAIKVTSPGPAFFRQTREGRGGKPFTIYKMRTMHVGAEKMQAKLREENHRDGPAFKIKHDPRVTPVGHFLRKTCIDELPQFINVLRGEMSLVGPRPLPWHESRACRHWHRRRLDVKPGITCHWQVNKSAAPTFDDWMRMDLRYVDRAGFWQDVQLLAKTVIVPISGRGNN